MNKRELASFALWAMLFALWLPAEAQQPAKVARIGWVTFSSASSQSPGAEPFRREFRALGYVEGKNVAFEYRYAEGKLDRLPAVADELVRLKVDVIVTASSASSLAAKNATTTIPIVFHNISDPVATGLVDSLARPGGNITGFTTMATVLAGKRLELLKETIPSSTALHSCGIHRLKALRNNGKKANSRHENWVCSFIPWR